MDDQLKAKLQGSEVSFSQWYDGEHNRETNQNVTIWVNPPCDVTLNKQEIAQIGAQLEKHGLTIDYQAHGPKTTGLPDNNITLIDRKIDRTDITATVANLKEALKDIDPEITTPEFLEPKPAPTCGIPVASIEKDSVGRSA